MITEPVVALTDYGLALECAAFTCLLLRDGRRPSLAGWFTLFFGSLSVGALLGGTVHGFFLDETTIGYRLLWPATLIAIGLTAVAAWGIASGMLLSPQAARRVSQGAAGLFLLYAGVVLFVKQTYSVALLHYLPPAIFLFVAWLVIYRRTRTSRALIGVSGLGLTFIAAGIQQERVAIHPIYFDHNALYHLVQAAALLMIFLSARALTSGAKE